MDTVFTGQVEKRSSPAKRWLSWRIEWLLLRSLGWWMYCWPLRWAHWPGRCLGWTLYWLGFRRRATMETLKCAFGSGLDVKAQRKLAWHGYGHFGGLMTEILVLPRIPRKYVEKHARLENVEMLLDAYKEGGGVLLLGGHLGAWEVMLLSLAAWSLPVSAYAGFQRNPLADAELNRIRRSLGIKVVAKREGMRGLLRELRAGRVLIVLGDQHFSKNRLFVRFFGQVSSVAPGPGLLMRATDAVPLFFSCVREGALRYRIRFYPLTVSKTTDKEQALLDFTQRYFQALEASVLEHPQQYFWMHRRWRKLSLDSIGQANRDFLQRWEMAGDAPLARLPQRTVPVQTSRKNSSSSAQESKNKQVLFLDRDGVLVEECDYLDDLSKLQLLPGAALGVKIAVKKGWRVFVVTNQSGIARGLFDECFVAQTHQRLQELLIEQGAAVEAIYHSPWHSAGQAPWDRVHPDRKPAAGMLLRACKVHGLSLRKAVMVGDRLSDLQTAAALGVRPLLVRSGYGRCTEAEMDDAFLVEFRRRGGCIFDGLLEAVEQGL